MVSGHFVRTVLWPIFYCSENQNVAYAGFEPHLLGPIESRLGHFCHIVLNPVNGHLSCFSSRQSAKMQDFYSVSQKGSTSRMGLKMKCTLIYLYSVPDALRIHCDNKSRTRRVTNFKRCAQRKQPYKDEWSNQMSLRYSIHTNWNIEQYKHHVDHAAKMH